MGLTGPIPSRVNAHTKTVLLDLVDKATGSGWTRRQACDYLQLGYRRHGRWAANRSCGLTDKPPGGVAVNQITPAEEQQIIELFQDWGQTDRSHRKLAHRGSWLPMNKNLKFLTRFRGTRRAWYRYEPKNNRREGERGDANIEFVVWGSALVLTILLGLYAFRLSAARGEIQDSAQAGARAASLARTPTQAASVGRRDKETQPLVRCRLGNRSALLLPPTLILLSGTLVGCKSL